MDKTNEKYESVREKLRKLQALAERGYGGEVEAAKAGIKRLCERYGITPEELLEMQDNDKKERYTFYGRPHKPYAYTIHAVLL